MCGGFYLLVVVVTIFVIGIDIGIDVVIGIFDNFFVLLVIVVL